MLHEVEQLAELDAVFILHSYRSGSNYVASVFDRNGFGAPSEHFNGIYKETVRNLSDSGIRDHAVGHILDLARNGVFACKAPLDNLGWMTRAIGDSSDPLGSVARRFRTCSVVMMERQDIFLQAISFWRAGTTGAWFRFRGENKCPPAPDFDAVGIYERYIYLTREAFVWPELFQRSGIAPLRLKYEDMVDRPELIVDAMEKIALRIDPEGLRFERPFHVESDHIRARDEVSEDYRERFVRWLVQNISS